MATHVVKKRIAVFVAALAAALVFTPRAHAAPTVGPATTSSHHVSRTIGP